MPLVGSAPPRPPLAARSAARCALVAALLLDVGFRGTGGGGDGHVDGGRLSLSLSAFAAVRRPAAPDGGAPGRHGGGRAAPSASCRFGNGPLGARGSTRCRRRIPRAAAGGDDDAGGADWREFRARLVEKERGGKGIAEQSTSTGGWAYASPLIEKGSVLLCQGGDHFALNQQYFHKALLLVIRHSEDGTTGLILNRPSAFTTQDVDLFGSDLPLDQVTKALGLSKGSEAWPVWFGGDCQGLELRDAPPGGLEFRNWDLEWRGPQMAYFCLHALEGLADQSEEVIRGVYLISLMLARAFVQTGRAKKEDFMVLSGYCGWRPGQLQRELDSGGVWTLLAADQKALVTALSGSSAAAEPSLSSVDPPSLPPLWLAPARGASWLTFQKFPASTVSSKVGDGIAQWQRLQTALGGAAADAARSDDKMSLHVDDMLRLWIDTSLLPDEGEAGAPGAGSLSDKDIPKSIDAGTVLRCSATDWLLGSPTGATRTRETMRLRPAQFLHKAVLLLVKDWVPGRAAMLVVLNGPRIGWIGDGSGEVFFGGTNTSHGAPVLRIPAGVTLGCMSFAPGVMEELLRLGAIEVAHGVSFGDTLTLPVEERWLAAGGELNSLRDVSIAAMGDQQRLLWFQQFLGLTGDE